MLKKLLITTAVSGLMLSSALAQSSMSPSSDAGMKSSAGSATVISAQKPNEWLASKFKGTDVLGPDNQKVGDVTDILFSKDGKIDAYIVSVGGFLGVGTKNVALAPSAFQVVPGDDKSSDKLKISMTKDQLKEAANFESNSSTRTTTGSATPGAMAPASSTAPKSDNSYAPK